nr:MAG TPA: hypothetical protein [Caudoviricetes sp.]
MMPRDCYVLARQQGQYLNGHKHAEAIEAIVGLGYIIASHTEGATMARLGDCTIYDRGDDTYVVTNTNRHRRLCVDAGSPEALHELLDVIKDL